MDPILNSSMDFSNPYPGSMNGMNGMNPYSVPSGNSQDSLSLIEQNLQQAQEQYAALRKQRAPMMQHYQPPSSTPIWDEISRIQDSLSSNQLNYLEAIPEYNKSFNAVAIILNREYMRLMRPLVEQTQDGKVALQHHLEVLRRLVKQAKDEADQQAMLMSDYTQHYSHLTFDQYLQLRNGGASNRQAQQQMHQQAQQQMAAQQMGQQERHSPTPESQRKSSTSKNK